MSYIAVSALNSNWNGHRLNVNGNNHGDNRNGYAFGIALVTKILSMKTYNNLYPKIISKRNLHLTYKKARKGKAKKDYVKRFEEDLERNLSALRSELLIHSYNPHPMKTFILRDPKTRNISKSDFRDRIVHHALCKIIEPIFDKTFIYDSYANRKGKGTLKALKRLDYFKKKVSRNGKVNGWFNNNQVKGYVLKADIKHYFETINHEILLASIKKRIKCKRTLWLIKKVLANYHSNAEGKGMPLGNLTSQFFANIYLNELDYFIKHNLKAKYYIRYVDDFVILNTSKKKLKEWKDGIDKFLKINLKLELHPDKSQIISLNKPINFLGFRIFYHYKLLKKSNRDKIKRKLKKFKKEFSKNKTNYDEIYDSFQGSFAYMEQANTFRFKKELQNKLEGMFHNQVSSIEVNKYLKYRKNFKNS